MRKRRTQQLDPEIVDRVIEFGIRSGMITKIGDDYYFETERPKTSSSKKVPGLGPKRPPA